VGTRRSQGKDRKVILATMKCLSTIPIERLRRIEWCSLFLEHLDEFATLVWYLTADRSLLEFVFLRTLARLETITFRSSLPLYAYNRARDMLIKEAKVVALKQWREEAGLRLAGRRLDCELPDLGRLASLLERMACREEDVSDDNAGSGQSSRRRMC
jgi:hypothetical protein